MKIEDAIIDILNHTDSNGRLLNRERTNLEYKKSFVLKQQYSYAKTMAAFANRNGGIILFGIKDKPREIVGVGNYFDEIKTEKFTDLLKSTFSPEIEYELGNVEYNNFIIGYIYTYESDNKPVIAVKNESSEKICNGDIFYRYNARTEKIEFPELQKIIKDREEKIRTVLLNSFESIIKSGTTNIGIVNYEKGSFKTPNGIDVSVDKNLIVKVLKRAKFIKEGEFDEVKGKPVIKITGEIDLSESVSTPDIEPDIQYPYIQKQLAEKLKIKSAYYIRCIIYKFRINDEKKYHIEVTTSKSGSTHKYSDLALQHIADILNQHKDEPNFLQEVAKEYYTSTRS
jgi:hypothetical protein